MSLARLLVPVALCALLASVARAEPEKKPGPVPGSFTIENFRLEGGVTLPKAIVVYGTYGTLNAAKDNAVLLPSHYMAQSDGYDWLIGEGRVLDPKKHFLIMTELFGNGRSSSPSNTPQPFHGPRFPVMSYRSWRRDRTRDFSALSTSWPRGPHSARASTTSSTRARAG